MPAPERLAAQIADAARRLADAGIPADEAAPEARLLFRHALGLSRERLLLRDQPLTDPERAALEPLLERRARREPLAYIVGERGFHGLTFRVTPDVLIPRPETELLVEEAVAHLLRGPWNHNPQVADIGTGSGCVAVAILHRIPWANVHATDLSPAALAVAADNAARNGMPGGLRLFEGDLCAPLPADHRFHAIVSNPPYIAPVERDTLAPEVRDWEPPLALFDPDGDGLGLYRRLAADAPGRLVPGGLLAVEVGMGQADAVEALWREAGLTRVRSVPDLAGIPRVVRGERDRSPVR